MGWRWERNRVGLQGSELGGSAPWDGSQLGSRGGAGPQGAPRDPKSFRLALETGKKERAEQGEAHASPSARRLAGGESSTAGWSWSATARSPSPTASQTTSPSLPRAP